MLLCCAVLYRRARRRRIPADDPQQAYSVYTREFDVECRGRDVAALLESDGTRFEYPATDQITDLSARRKIALAAKDESAPIFLSRADAWGTSEWSCAVLIDQSGSMADRMPVIAGQLSAFVACLGELDIPCTLLGYTSRGWRGGKARQLWKSNGRPKYPGRLCALLHITYKGFGELLSDDDWQAMLQADLLRENIDGEAIEWAATLLKKRSENKRLLIVLSDGAPVDDSTLMENGAGILSRHLQCVIGDLVGEGLISLGAIGIEHRVAAIYPSSRTVGNLGGVPNALADLIDALLVRPGSTAD